MPRELPLKPQAFRWDQFPLGRRFDRAAYRELHQGKRCINRLTQNRALATHDEKLQETFHALLTMAAILLCFPV